MFKNPFSFKGRIRRTEYGITAIVLVIAAKGLTTVSTSEQGLLLGTYIPFMIPIMWALIAQGAKRAHDVGDSGWMQLFPLYGLLLLLMEGQDGPNKYGEDPKGIKSNDLVTEKENNNPDLPPSSEII